MENTAREFDIELNTGKTKRFTNKFPETTPTYYKYYLNGYHFEQGDFIEKLGQVEDIEEELGIDIKIFIMALLNGIYVKVDGKIIDFTNSVGWLWKFDKNDSWYDEERPNEYYFAIIYRHVNEFYMKDYGKTWALTKEELEN